MTIAKKIPLPSRNISNYGWRPDLPDYRDLIYPHATKPVSAALPTHVDLRSGMPPVYDQGQLGSCTANAIAGAVEYDLKRQKATDFIPSRLFIYYNERIIENDTQLDNGAQIRDGIKTVNKLGVVPETMWPYSDKNPGTFQRKPTVACYTEALKHQVTTYMAVTQSEAAIKTCLAEGFPVVFGFSVFDAFESDAVAKTGILNLPAPGEQNLGGHAVLCVGYDDASKRFLVRNSWGAAWGQSGYFSMPYAYLTNSRLASDLWTVRAIEQG